MPFLIAGFIGGLLRGGMGLAKYMTSYKDVEIRPLYFLGSIVLSGIIGYVAAWVAKDVAQVFLEISTTPISFALIAGYAGGDMIENLFKIGMKEPNLFEIGKKIKTITATIEED
jgi:fructose-specific phosphotransferase system IIC component